MTDRVLDASALLAFLGGEPGGEAVGPMLEASLVSAVNMAEVMTKLVDRGIGAVQAAEVIRALPCRVTAFDLEAGLAAGALRSATVHRGLSLGDRACLALGRAEQLPVLTADCAWAALDLGVEVVLIR